MKQMKNGVAIGAVALFALTGCVTDLTYVPQDKGDQPCVTGPCDDGSGKVSPKPRGITKGMGQGIAPPSPGPTISPKNPGQYPDPNPGQYPDNGLPANVQPGECYSRCLAPAVFEDVEEQIEIAPAMEQTEIIPAEYEWVEEQVVVKEASEKIRVIPAKYDWVEEQVVVKEASEEIKVIPARYESQSVQEVVKEETEELKAIPAVYAWREGQVMVSPEITTVTITNPGYEEIKEQVLVKEPSAKWIKKATHCSPEDIKMGLTDCDTLCYVAVPAMYKTVVKKVPKDCSGQMDGCRQEIVIPPKYKPFRTKVVVEPARTETVTIPAEYRAVRKKVIVEPARTEVIPVPAQYKTVRVKKLVKEAEERVVQVPAEYKTITKKVKVSDSKIVWRPALCEDEAVDSKIRALQSALSREGFYTGAINGVLNQETNQAIRAYQVESGLPQGGGMTLETLESLGIY
jgi:regulator of extracellular matrix RemA (YlzA/DUF370 family)